MIEKAVKAASFFRRFVPVVTFIAGTITTAVGGHKLYDSFAATSPAIRINSVSLGFGGGGVKSVATIDFDKLRTECTRDSANIQFYLKDGTVTGTEVKIAGQFTTGHYVVKGTFDGPRFSDLDLSLPPIYHAKYYCGEDEVTTSSCVTYLSGAAQTSCEGVK
jgi:hypothetical protein